MPLRKLNTLCVCLSCPLVTHNFLVLFPFPGRSQWGGGGVLPGWVSLEGASVFPGEGSPGRGTNQVRPLPRPEWTVEGSVCPRWAQHLSEQVI